VLTPSIRVLFVSSLVPFTVNSSERAGFVGIECELAGGANPGSIR
jgi:hypothetical protein